MTSYTNNNFTININLTKDSKISDAGRAVLEDRYMLDSEISPQTCFARAATSYASNNEHAQRLYNYISDMWFMPSTPILSNASTKRGMPISCFLQDIDDSVKGIMEHHYESGFLASYGGGLGGNWSKLRSDGTATSRGNITTGIIPFIKMMDSQMMAMQQGISRRGAYAAYLDISHPEILEFLDIRNAVGSKDINRRCLGTGFHHAVNIPDSFMSCVEFGATWDLIDPHTKKVVKTVDARTLWMKILTTRMELGEPYIFFIDTANKALPQPLKDAGLRINNSNLCIEVMLPTSPDRTAVCCLSSVNLEFYDDWKNSTYFIYDIMEFLDNVLDSFIKNAPGEMWRAKASAFDERSIGLGTMGFHLYLQKKGIPFESPMATGINKKIFQHIKSCADEASLVLAVERGEAPVMTGTKQRFSHKIALAPNASSANICGDTSPSIEPFNSNGYKWVTLSGTFLIKNKELDRLFKEVYNLDTETYEDVWSSIITTQGSVQHLNFLSEIHKEVFKTSFELDQRWIIDHASTRQPYICQGQSVNLFLRPDIHKSELHELHYMAWKQGLKGLYYCRSKPIKQTATITEFKQRFVSGTVMDVLCAEELEFREKECLSCQ